MTHLASLAVLAALLIGMACTDASEDGGASTLATPTESEGRIITSVDEALRFVAPRFVVGDGRSTAQTTSLSYVETTVGETRQLFEPNGPRSAPEVPDDAGAFAFVGYGQYEGLTAIGGFTGEEGSQTPATASTAWIVVPKDGAGGGRLLLGYSDEQYDLSQLGTPMEVELSVLRQLCDEVVGGSC